ncbi:MAG: hypothetical protein U0M33_04425 [Lachnospiraceae bacterium]|nr:hypothetical protein [Lachnospiraceae bacterium]
MKRWSRKIRRAAALLCAAAFCAPFGCAYAEEAPMGRFVCEQMGFPELSEGAMAYDIVQTQEGNLRMATAGGEDGVTLWDSSDAGQTWQEAGRLPEEYGGWYYISIELCVDGGGAGLAISGEKQYYVSFDAQGNADSTQQQEDARMWRLAFAADGRLAAQSYSGEAVVLDRETGTVVQTLGDIGADAVTVCENETFAIAGKEVFRYDLDTGEPLSRDESLEQALFESADTYEITTSFGRPVVFADDAEGRLYYCTNKGIFSHVMGGSVVEQIVDGEMTSLSDPSVQLLAMEEADGAFYVLTMGNGGATSLLRFAYSDDTQSVPPDTLTVYSLEENDLIRHAASQYQIEHPEIYVEYQVGLSGGDAVTSADAVRTLNTQILAGEGPDILVLDGMPVDDYADQGVLADISTILNEVKETDGLLENIAYAKKQENGVYAAPVQFAMVAAAGEAETVSQLGSALGERSGSGSIEKLRELSQEAGLLSWSTVSYLAKNLYPLYSVRWVQEDGTLDEEVIRQYVSLCADVYQNTAANADAKESEFLSMYREYETELLTEQTYYDDYPVSEPRFDLVRADKRLSVGILGDLMDYISLLSIEDEMGSCRFVLPEQEGGAIFIPYTMIGMSSAAKAEEQASDFIRYLFSADAVQAGVYTRFPVNRTLFERILHPTQETIAEIEQTTYGEDPYENDEAVTITCRWLSEEEIKALADAADSLSVCANMDSVQRDTVLEDTKKCMYGMCTVDEAVNSIMQKLNLYLAE